MSRQRAGLVIQNIGDEPKLLANLKAMNPVHVIVISNPAFAIKVAQTLPDTLVWHRYHSDEEAKFWTEGRKKIDSMIKSFREDGLDKHPNIGLYVLNEVRESGARLQDALKWIVDFIDTVHGSFPLLVWNGGVGNYEQWQLEMGYFDALFDASHRYHGKVFIGLHEYAGPLVWLGSAGRSELEHFDPPKARTKPSVWDVQVVGVVKRTNWLVGDAWNYIEHARKLGKTKARFIISELGPDDITKYRETIDLYERIGREYGRKQIIDGKEKWLKMPLPHYEWGGWNCYQWYYEAIYKGVYTDHIHERVIFDTIQWYDFIYADYEFVFGTTVTRDPTTAYNLLTQLNIVPDVRKVNIDDPTIAGFTIWLHSPDKKDWDVVRGGSLHRFPFVYELWKEWTRELESQTPPPVEEPTEPETPPTEPPPPAVEVPGATPEQRARIINACIMLAQEYESVSDHHRQIYIYEREIAEVYRQIAEHIQPLPSANGQKEKAS